MSPHRYQGSDLDSLIEEIIVDSYNEDEQLTGFETALYDANLPFPGTVVGEPVEILHIGRAEGRHELIATCQRNGRRYEVALLDIDISADPATSRLVSAYRRWIGAQPHSRE